MNEIIAIFTYKFRIERVSMSQRFDATRPDLELAVIGSGIMGRGIAQISALAGIKTLVFDTNQAALKEAHEELCSRFDSLAAKGKLRSDDAAKAKNNLRMVGDIESVRTSHVVVEAIKEDLDIKRKLFANLEAIVSDNCILASNTSSLSITAIQAGLKKPGRFGGLHFFNPVPLMKIAEVITGHHSEEWIADGLTELTNRLGHKSVRAKDFPGFIVNHAGRGYGTEALRILGEDIAPVQVIDDVLKATGFRMGPFELLDLIGLDISHTVMESIYNQFYQEPRFRPSAIAKIRVDGGLLGRKSGRGFYDYGKDAAPLSREKSPDLKVDESFWIERSDKQVSLLITKLGGKIASRPDAETINVVLPIGKDTTSTVAQLQLNPERTIALDTIYSLEKHRTLMTNPATNKLITDKAQSLFSRDGITTSIINDSPGFISQRVQAMVVNVGCDIAQQGIAEPTDIDTAVTLGLGYPKGPLALGDSIGPGTVLKILEELYDFYGDPRYRPSPWLKRRALLNMSLLIKHNR